MSSNLNGSPSWSDNLAETKFKPWFEAWRGYIVGLLFALSLYMIYTIKPQDHIFCYREDNISFTSEELSYVKSFCVHESGNWELNIGWIMLGSSIFTLLVNSLWLTNPMVRNLFTALREFETKFKDLGVTFETVRERVFYILYGKQSSPPSGLQKNETDVIKDIISCLESLMRMNERCCSINAKQPGIYSAPHDESLFLEKRKQLNHGEKRGNIVTKQVSPPRKELLRTPFPSHMSRHESGLMYKRDPLDEE